MLREYLAHVRASLPTEEAPATAAWLTWADQVVEDLDPAAERVDQLRSEFGGGSEKASVPVSAL